MNAAPSPRLSIVVPVHNDRALLRRCLEALIRAMAVAKVSTELIVVDDGSTEDIAPVVPAQVHVVRLEDNRGPATARNAGARVARGRVLLFVDADVAVAPDAVARVVDHFRPRRRRAAVIGSYDDRPEGGIVSRYRNLLHHHTHQQAPTEISHFWTGLGAVRRRLFWALGGFDEGRRALEDVEFGYRLSSCGYAIALDKHLQGTHLKRWTLASMVRTDVFTRALPWAALLLREKTLPDDLSFSWNHRGSAMTAGLSVACGWGGLLWWPLGLVAVAAAGGFVALNQSLFALLWRRGGPWFALSCLPLHLFYYSYTGLALAFGVMRYGLLGRVLGP
ncbi:MAG: glycosyltransferase family 2 protein [Candidatus Competibacterales bacterium]